MRPSRRAPAAARSCRTRHMPCATAASRERACTSPRAWLAACFIKSKPPPPSPAGKQGHHRRAPHLSRALAHLQPTRSAPAREGQTDQISRTPPKKCQHLPGCREAHARCAQPLPSWRKREDRVQQRARPYSKRRRPTVRWAGALQRRHPHAGMAAAARGPEQ